MHFRFALITVLLAALVMSVVWIPSAAAAQDDEAGESWLPAPTGPYQVGRAEYHLVDDTREEIFTDNPDDVRELMVYIYYPAEPPPDATPVPYLDDALRAAFEADGAGPEFFAATDPVQPHAFAAVSLSDAESSYPVLIFMPGGVGMPFNYTALIEEVASHGYIVVATSQSYNSLVTVFPDGRTAYGIWDLDEVMSGRLYVDWEEVLSAWGADAVFVLDQLEVFNETDPLLAGRLDLERVGIWGHSMGGTTAVWACQQDDRFKAAVDMDGEILDSMFGYDLIQPVMVMSHSPSLPCTTHARSAPSSLRTAAIRSTC